MTGETNDRTLAFYLEPMDVLFFRDARPLDASTRGISGLPMPQTLSGALRTAFLRKYECDFAKLAANAKKYRIFAEVLESTGVPAWIAELRVKGPWLARLNSSGEVNEVFVPVPAILKETKANNKEKKVFRLHPLSKIKLPSWQPPEEGLYPLWHWENQPLKPVKGYLSLKGLTNFLSGGTPEPEDIKERDKLYGFDIRTGIQIDYRSQTSAEGLIYGASFLALGKKVGFYTELVLPPEAPSDAFDGISLIPLGGEGKYVKISSCNRVSWPEPQLRSDAQKFLLLLTTPGIFVDGWRPKFLRGRLAAAAVTGYVPVSGWDLARGGPKPSRFAASAGSVYFLNNSINELPDSLADDPEDRLQGWGCYLKGVWSDER